MLKLSKKGFDDARNYILTYGRDVEQALFRFHFENGNSDEIEAALKKYQNEDGGFGHGMEPDLRSKNSSVIATNHALEISIKAGITGESQLVQQGISYLIRQFDETRKVWQIIPPAVHDVPLPPWWRMDTLEESFGGFKFNPTVGVVAILLHYGYDGDFVSKQLDILEDRLKYLKSTISFYDFRNFLNLLERDTLESDYRERVISLLTPKIQPSLDTMPINWSGYSFNPCNIIHSPQSPFLKEVGDLMEHNLDFDIANQMSVGSWPLNWSWADRDPQGWKAADLAWRGIISLQKLLLFRAFDRLN